MESSGGDRLSEEQAQALWRRAAQLQAESARREEDRTRQLAAGDVGEETSFRLADVETAAVEAGIAREFMRLARAETVGRGSAALPPRTDRWATRVLASDRRMLEVARIIEASPEAVLATIGRVFPANPYYLNLADTVGDPLDGGVLAFDVTRSGGFDANSFGWEMALSDLRQLLVMLRPVAESGGKACDVVIGASLNFSRRLNLGVGSALIGLGAAGGGAAGAAIGASVLGLGALAALPMVAAAVGVAGLATAGYRRLYGWGIGRGRRALEDLLRAVEVRLRGGELIPPAQPPRPAVPPP